MLDVVAVRPWGSPLLRAIQSTPEAFEAIPAAMFKGLLREYIQNAAYKTLTDAKMDEFIHPWTDVSEDGKRRFIRQIRWMSQEPTRELESLIPQVMHSDDDSPKKLKILWGEKDNWLNFETGERLAKWTESPEFVRIPEAGHLVQVDRPEIVTVEILTWLAKVAQ